MALRTQLMMVGMTLKDAFSVLIKYLIIFSINRISKMNSIRSNKQTFRVSCEDFSAAMDQKNSMISSLQNEVNCLRANQQRFDKVKQQLLKSKGKYQSLMRDYETKVGNNEQVLQLSARNVYELRMHLDSISEELCLRANALKQAKFTTQQLIDFQNKKEEEGSQILYKIQQQKNIKDMRSMEEERTRLQIAQVKEEVIKGKREISMIRGQTQSIAQKCHKTQNYLRSLVREEANLNESLSKVEDENTYIDASIADLDTIISINQTTISNKQKDCREMEFQISSKELQRKKIDNEIRQKVKQLSSEKEKWRNLCQQWQQTKRESNRLDSLIGETSEEINFILSKNGQIRDVNNQLKQDLTVCGRHFDNLTRINKCLQQEIKQMHSVNQKAISKLRQPFSNRVNGQSPKREAIWQKQDHYSKYQTGDFQNCSWK